MSRRRPGPEDGRPTSRRRPRWGLAALVCLLAVAAALAAPAVRLTLHPHPDDAPHVDALLVAYSSPEVYEAAIELADRGVTDRLFVSAHLGPDGSEALCGDPAQRDPRLAGVAVECFSPDPLTTQGEAMYAGRRMAELRLRDLGVLAFDAQLERARILAQRCWPAEAGTVSMYVFERPSGGMADGAVQTAYNVLALAKAQATPGCDQELPGVLQWALDMAKRLRGQPVEARLVRGQEER